MYTVGADLWHSFYDSDYVRSCLKQLVGNDHSYVSGSDHQNPLPWENSLYICHRLGRACSHDARKGPSWEPERILRTACTKKQFLRLYDFCLSLS